MGAGRNDNPAGGSGGDSDSVTFLFDTTHDAMRAEEALIDAGYWCDLVPRPPDSAATLCGLAIAVQSGDSEGIAALLKREGVAHAIYQGVQPT